MSPGTVPPRRPLVTARPGRHGNSTVLRGLLVAALLVLPAAAAAGVTAAQPSRYAAELELLHEPEDNSTVESVERELATHQVLLRQRPLLEDVADAVGRSPRDVADSLAVEVVDDSSVLRVVVVDVDPDRAREALDVLVDRYLMSGAELAAGSDIGRLRVLAAPAVLDEPVGPDPLRAAAAGLLLGMTLAVGLLALLRYRHGRSRAA